MIPNGLRPMSPDEGTAPDDARYDDDDDISRRMLDGLLGGRPERLARRDDRICLATPRGLEVIELPDYRRLPRVDPGCRLLGMAHVADGIALLDETGRVTLWDGSDRLRERLPAGGSSVRCRRLRGRDDRLLLGGSYRLELRDAGTGALRASGTVDHPGRISALALGLGDTVLAARSQGVAALQPAGDRLVPEGLCVLGEGEVLALAETRPDPGGDPVIVAFDEFGWLHVLTRGGADGLQVIGAVELEIDGGAPERGGLACDGPMVTVASGTRMLHLVDLRSATGVGDPVPMAAMSIGTGLADVVVDDAHVFLADSFQGLLVVDRQLLQVCDDDPVLARVALHDSPVL